MKFISKQTLECPLKEERQRIVGEGLPSIKNNRKKLVKREWKIYNETSRLK